MANIAFVSDKERKEGFTHVVLILTGSVASIKAPLIVSELSAVSIQSICAQELRANIANIIQYDKVGCKRSTHLQEKANAGEEFWNENLFIAELHNLVCHFGLDAEGRQYDVLGHSWGGMFGSSFAAEKPKRRRRPSKGDEEGLRTRR